MAYLLGVDAGGTVLKAVLYDTVGRPVSTGRARCPGSTPNPGWAERDMDALWDTCVTAIRACLAGAPAGAATAIAAVGVVGHNDGLYLVDAALRPVRPAILSTDARATAQVQRWQRDGTSAAMREVIGQEPFVASPQVLAAWLHEHEPTAVAATRWTLYCKDWLRLRLTGEVGTDPTEASAGFLDVNTREYSDAALAAFGLRHMAASLPPLSASTAVVGAVTREAADRTGLAAGTPVVCGAHDVHAAAIGVGAVSPGDVSVVAGTFAINQVVTDTVHCDSRWQCRQWIEPGRWLAMATSPASASNLDWFTARFGPDSLQQVNREVAAVLDEPSDLMFLPFLYGAPHGVTTGGAFVGLRGWHERGHLLRAVYEGVVLGHRRHLSHLRDAFTMTGPVRLTGGGARSAIWCQQFADAFGRPVQGTDTPEAGARGAAVLAGLGIDAWPDLDTAVEQTVRAGHSYLPRDAATRRYDARFAHFERLIASSDLFAPPSGAPAPTGTPPAGAATPTGPPPTGAAAPTDAPPTGAATPTGPPATTDATFPEP